jgi:hypothetical protein
MSEDSHNWLDALTDGQILRDWLALVANFGLGLGYFIFVTVGFTIAVSLIPLLVGIPLVLFMLATIRTLAVIDRQLVASLLQIDLREVVDDVDARGANLGSRLGFYLGSATTWRSLLYLAVRFGVGMISLVVASLIWIPLAFELLLLAPLTIDMHLISVRLLHFTAVQLSKFGGFLLPTQKGKRIGTLNRLALEDDEPRVYLTDDGELVEMVVKSGARR